MIRIPDPTRAPIDSLGAGVAGGLRAIDPRVRIVATVAFATAVVALDGFVPLALSLMAAFLAAVSARLPPAATLRRVMAMDLFVVFTLLMLPFTVPGDPILRLGPWTASEEGVAQATTIALKANAVVLAALALVGTIEAIRLGHALSRLRLPDTLVHLSFFTVRYIEVLAAEHRRLRWAMKARAFRARSDRHTWRSIGYLVGMVLVRSFERSERILAAMKCRGYVGRLHVLDSLALRPADGVFVAAAVALIAALLWLDRA